jgi:hypothetical protein
MLWMKDFSKLGFMIAVVRLLHFSHDDLRSSHFWLLLLKSVESCLLDAKQSSFFFFNVFCAKSLDMEE